MYPETNSDSRARGSLRRRSDDPTRVEFIAGPHAGETWQVCWREHSGSRGHEFVLAAPDGAPSMCFWAPEPGRCAGTATTGGHTARFIYAARP